MEFLSKLENLINSLIFKLSGLTVAFISKITPVKVKNFLQKIKHFIQFIILNFKRLPEMTKALLLNLVIKLKGQVSGIDFKAVLKETYQKALEEYKARAPKGGNKLKEIFMMPFLMMAEWLKGLTITQSMLLMTFTSASFLSVIGIVSKGERMIQQHFGERAPASIEEVEYSRPDYYKKERRHFELTNLRLPVYVAEINELRSIDIDVIATVSNREARMFLEKWEFQLRDHLILHVEPSIAAFPLEEEGKAIIRRKIQFEINAFLESHQIEGSIEEVKISYILAN
ncbi:MAG: hypothetical protein AB7I27_06835 [Bacteriovoracaceae bacterium]